MDIKPNIHYILKVSTGTVRFLLFSEQEIFYENKINRFWILSYQLKISSWKFLVDISNSWTEIWSFWTFEKIILSFFIVLRKIIFSNFTGSNLSEFWSITESFSFRYKISKRISFSGYIFWKNIFPKSRKRKFILFGCQYYENWENNFLYSDIHRILSMKQQSNSQHSRK